jgi:hypothetical protein
MDAVNNKEIARQLKTIYSKQHTASESDLTFDGEPGSDNFFGDFVAVGGDVNGDGYRDILVSSVGYPNSGHQGRGRAYLYYRGVNMDEACDPTFTGELRWELGCGLAAYDIDADDFADVIIGSHMGCNRAWLHWGGPRSSFDTSADVIFTGENQSDDFGNYVNVGRIDDDQYPDIMINAYNYGGGIGRSYLYNGGTRGEMDSVADHTFEASMSNWLSFQTNLVDVNNDGYDDVLRSGPGYNNFRGRALLWFGPFNTSTEITFTWDTTNASIGKHNLKVEIPPVPGEQNTEDNVKTVTIEVKDPWK